MRVRHIAYAPVDEVTALLFALGPSPLGINHKGSVIVLLLVLAQQYCDPTGGSIPLHHQTRRQKHPVPMAGRQASQGMLAEVGRAPLLADVACIVTCHKQRAIEGGRLWQSASLPSSPRNAQPYYRTSALNPTSGLGERGNNCGRCTTRRSTALCAEGGHVHLRPRTTSAGLGNPSFPPLRRRN